LGASSFDPSPGRRVRCKALFRHIAQSVNGRSMTFRQPRPSCPGHCTSSSWPFTGAAPNGMENRVHANSRGRMGLRLPRAGLCGRPRSRAARRRGRRGAARIGPDGDGAATSRFDRRSVLARPSPWLAGSGCARARSLCGGRRSRRRSSSCVVSSALPVTPEVAGSSPVAALRGCKRAHSCVIEVGLCRALSRPRFLGLLGLRRRLPVGAARLPGLEVVLGKFVPLTGTRTSHLVAGSSPVALADARSSVG
jgi:hypothetical protein